MCRIMKCRYGIDVIAYIDDFLIISDSGEACAKALSQLLRVLRFLGFQISWKKVDGPRTNIVFLGIEIDTRTCTQTKLTELKHVLEKSQQKKLESLIGKLNWACSVIQGV